MNDLKFTIDENLSNDLYSMKDCKIPRERIGNLLKDGKHKKCQIPPEKLKYPKRSKRPDVIQWLKQSNLISKETNISRSGITKELKRKVDMSEELPKVENVNLKINQGMKPYSFPNHINHTLAEDKILDVRVIGSIFKKRYDDKESIAFAKYIKQSNKTRRVKNKDISIWDWYLDDYRKVSKTLQRPYGLLDYVEDFGRENNPIYPLYKEFLKTYRK